MSEHELGHRVAFADAMIPGQGVTEHKPGSPAAREMERLLDWLSRQLDGPTGRTAAKPARRRVAA